MAIIKKINEIKLPFVTINILDMNGHADVLENIPDFVTKIRYQVTNSTKEPDGKTSEYEYGLSFTDVKPFPKHAENSIEDLVKHAIQYHLYDLTHQYVGKVIDNRTPQYEMSHSHLSRIMEIIREDRAPVPLKMEYNKNGKPTLQFGLGRDICVQVAPMDMKLKLTSMDKTHPFAFAAVLGLGDDEPLIEGSIEIFGETNNVYLWRKYNNKVFNTHAYKPLLAHEINHFLCQNKKLIDALGGYEQVTLHENNTDRLLKLA